MTAEGALELPGMRVRVDAARAAEFARETGFCANFDGAPSSYPALWLTAPAIHGAIMQICAQADSVPVHESQHFAYEAPLRLGADYDLAVSMRREEKPPRLIVEAVLATPDGAPVGRFETLLRLAPRAALRRDKDA
jgi:hypothetical protein